MLMANQRSHHPGRRQLAAFQRPLRNDLTFCLALNPCQYARWNWSTQLIVQLIINVESVRRHPPYPVERAEPSITSGGLIPHQRESMS